MPTIPVGRKNGINYEWESNKPIEIQLKDYSVGQLRLGPSGVVALQALNFILKEIPPLPASFWAAFLNTKPGAPFF